MAKHKRKPMPDEKAAKRQRRKEFVTVCINGKQKRMERPPAVDGIPAEEFIRRNADPIRLHLTAKRPF